MFHRRAAALIAAIAVISTACSSAATPAPAASGAATPAGSAAAGACTVGVSWNNYQQPRWAKADEPAMKKAIEDAGGKYIRADANLNMEQQLTDIDSMIGQGAKVLIILAQDTKLILPAIAKAKAANIPVISYDRLIEDENSLYLTFDNQKVGALEAEAITKAAPKGNYAIIKGNAGDPNSTFLRDGMKPFIDPLVASGAIKIVYEDFTTDWKTENAQKNMETALNKTTPVNDIQAVISENDSMAIGVVAALDKVGLSVPVSGQDGDEANLNNVAKGKQYVDVWKDAFALGRTAGDAAMQLCKGAKIADVKAPADLKDYVKPAAGVATQDFKTPGGKTVKSIILTPVAITKDNLNVPLDQGWITKDKLCAGVDAAKAPAACK